MSVTKWPVDRQQSAPVHASPAWERGIDRAIVVGVEQERRADVSGANIGRRVSLVD